MGIIKGTDRRLRELRYHLIFDDIDVGPDLDLVFDSLEWLYESGPVSRDWFVVEDKGRMVRYLKEDSPFYHYRYSRKYTFAFKERKDAILFKLLWYDALLYLDT